MSFKFHSIEFNHYDPGFTGGEWKWIPMQTLHIYGLMNNTLEHGYTLRLVFDNGSTIIEVNLASNVDKITSSHEEEQSNYYLELIKGFNGDVYKVEEFAKL